MLKIQEFIRNHSNWLELLSSDPYNLKITIDDGYVLFKYNQISSDFNEKICREARGLILDSTNNFRVVRLAFEKFFNIDESYADKIDWDTAVASEKIDGSIMSVWYARNEWHISTNGMIDAFKAELNGVGPYKTFGELFESVLPLSTFKGNRYENLCFTFELVSPYNKVVLDYPEAKLYLLSIRYMNTLNEVEYDELSAWAGRLGVDYPHFYYMNDEAGYRRVVEQMNGDHEGIVVRDEAGHRVKIKTLLYFEMHRARNNGVLTLERIVDLIRANDHYEFLSYFSEYTELFNDVKHQIDRAEEVEKKIHQDVALWKRGYNVEDGDRMVRKWFAQDFGKNKYAPLYFAEYDGRLNNTVQNMETKKFISMFNIKLKEEN